MALFALAPMLLFLEAGIARAEPAPLAATPAPGDAEARRATLYREGVDLANAGRWGEAASRFREVVALRSAPPALFTLAQAEEHLGRYVSAKRNYAKAHYDAEALGAHDVADAASRALTAVEPHIARLVLQVGDPKIHATGMIDGLPAPFGEPVEVDPGDHQVTVFAPNRPPWSVPVHVTEGERQEVNAKLALESAPIAVQAPPPPLPPPTGRASSFPTGPVVLGSVGLAAGIVGLVVRQTAESSYDQVSALCVNGVCPRSVTASEIASANSAQTRILVGTVTLASGLAVLGGAFVWWLATPKHAKDRPAAAFDVVPGPSGLRATASLRW